MATPRYIAGWKYWFQNYLEHWKLLHTDPLNPKRTLLLGLLLLTLGLLRWVVRRAGICLSQEELGMAMCYSLRGSALGSLMTRLTRGTGTMWTFGSRLQRKRPRLVGPGNKSGLFVTQVKYIESSQKIG